MKAQLMFVSLVSVLLLAVGVACAPTKTAQELCQEKGGVWTEFASGTKQCLPPSTTNTSSSGREVVPTIAYVPPPAPAPTAAPAAQEWFHVINRHTQKCLSAQAGTNWIVQETCRNISRQLWYWPNQADRIDLKSQAGPCVGGLSQKMEQAGCDGGKPWTLINYGTYYNPRTKPLNPHGDAVPLVYTGTYFELSFGNQCLDDEGWSHAEGQNIIHGDCRMEDNDNQLWGFY